jgi:dephospho-CoA kinase
MATTPTNPLAEQPDLSRLKGQTPFIGLTGGIGSGKTTVSDLLAKLGAGIVDTDLIAHQITVTDGKAMPEIERQFGQSFLNALGALDRPKMRALVFADPEARKILEAITHPLIRQETIRQAQEWLAKGAPYLVFVVPLLIESGSWQDLLDLLVVVDCPEEAQIARVVHRSNLSPEEVKRIIRSQASREERLSCADVVIENQDDLSALNAEVMQLHQKILQIKKDQPSSS